MSIIEPNTLARMKDDDVRMDFGVGSDKEVRMSKDAVVGKLNNLIYDLSNTATLTSNYRICQHYSSLPDQVKFIEFIPPHWHNCRS
jgi:hypothetical protein